jgi:GTP-binding protein
MPVYERKQALMPFQGEPRFHLSAHGLQQLPPDAGVEIAFAGRSNSGKSSAINALVHRRRLAFTSKTPGRTQTINFFALGGERFLVDLPGYGYAAVPAGEKRQWEKLISTYLQHRKALRALVLIMDARRPFTALDRQLLDWMMPAAKPIYALLSKADKLTRRQAAAALRIAQAEAARYPDCSVQLFSATTGIGVATARAALARWLK